MTNTDRNIFGAHYGKQLFDMLPPTEPLTIETTWAVHMDYSNEITLTARRKGHHEPTGGCKVAASPRSPSYGGMRREFVRHLKPGWTQRQFETAVGAVIIEARQAMAQIIASEHVYDIAETITADDEFIAAVECEEKASGYDCCYDTMTFEGAAHWRKWLNDYKAKHPDKVKAD